MPSKKEHILYGRNSVGERLRKNPATISKIIIADNFHSKEISQLIKKHRIRFQILPVSHFNKFKPQANLQGIIAFVKEFQYSFLDDILLSSYKRNLLLLDRITDPQNLGSIIRTCACLGNFGIILPKFHSCKITDAVLRVACGGENYTPIAQVSNLANALIKIKKAGYWVVASVPGGNAKNIYDADIPLPAAIILGSEGRGIRPGLEKYFDLEVKIPMPEAKLSLNVAVSAAIFCYEASRRVFLENAFNKE